MNDFDTFTKIACPINRQIWSHWCYCTVTYFSINLIFPLDYLKQLIFVLITTCDIEDLLSSQ